MLRYGIATNIPQSNGSTRRVAAGSKDLIHIVLEIRREFAVCISISDKPRLVLQFFRTRTVAHERILNSNGLF